MWAQVVPDVAAKTSLPRICRRLEVGSSVCSNSWTSDTGIAAKGQVHGRVKHHAAEYSDGKGKQINGLAGFRGYLNRRRAAKGGIGQERFSLDLAAAVGRDNHRNETIETQKKLVMKQLEKPRI